VNYCYTFFIFLIFFIRPFSVAAQKDTVHKATLDSFLMRQKGLLGDLAQVLLTDKNDNETGLQRNDKPYQLYKGRIIRKIIILPLKFGVSIGDTSKRINNRLTKLANTFHKRTREPVILNNLFFRANENLSPYVMSDNERHLRDLDFIQDAKFEIKPVGSDSVDITVITKDVLSLGGGIDFYGPESVGLTLKEDNLYGSGDRLEVQTLFDMKREEKFGYGAGFIKRNIGGSFIDASAGYFNFEKAFNNGKKEEQEGFLRMFKPLANRFMQWTYGAVLESHQTRNYYHNDSVYQYDMKYKYTIADGWGGWNMDADDIKDGAYNDKLRRLISVRVLQQNFSDKPLQYADKYFYQYANQTAVLGGFGIFRQNFYKSQYMYGFGRNEDVPEGIEASATAGWTKKNNINRLYAALDLQRYYFTANEHYFYFTIKLGSYFHHHQLEDVNLLGSVDYFSRLHQLNQWKQRSFLGLSVAKQYNRELDGPVIIESKFGFREFKNNGQGGDFRVSIKGESVFYSPWSLFLFRFAPFVFSNVSFFNQESGTGYDEKIFSSVGGGIRTRNESLIFGTIELKAMYFPRSNFKNENWKISFSTNVRFKYNKELIKRPEFVSVN
jgi:hypothetical protein